MITPNKFFRINSNNTSSGSLNITNSITGNNLIVRNNLSVGDNRSGSILVGNGTNYIARDLGGDATLDADGNITITNNSITNAMISSNDGDEITFDKIKFLPNVNQFDFNNTTGVLTIDDIYIKNKTGSTDMQILNKLNIESGVIQQKEILKMEINNNVIIDSNIKSVSAGYTGIDIRKTNLKAGKGLRFIDKTDDNGSTFTEVEYTIDECVPDASLLDKHIMEKDQEYVDISGDKKINRGIKSDKLAVKYRRGLVLNIEKDEKNEIYKENLDVRLDDGETRNNISIGFKAGWKFLNAKRNVAIGNNALREGNSDSCLDNVAIGYNALKDNTDGSGNIAIGSHVLEESQGSNNVGIGLDSLKNNETGSKNIAILPVIVCSALFVNKNPSRFNPKTPDCLLYVKSTVVDKLVLFICMPL